MGLRDKFETFVIRNYLWNQHEMLLKLVHNSMSSYFIVQHHMAILYFVAFCPVIA